MIQAKDLRIANWVSHNKEYGIIEVIYPNGAIVIYKGLPITLVDENIEPIPLTEEILLKCGFTLYNNGHYYEMAFNELTIDVSFELSHVSIWGRWDDGVEGIFIKIPDSLHKLQNLIYAITGEELDIDLSR